MQYLKKSTRMFSWIAFILMLCLWLTGCAVSLPADGEGKGSVQNGETAGIEAMAPENATQSENLAVQEKGRYTSKEEVALYIHNYGKLPENYITKKEAKELGWDNKKGNLWEVADGMSIGGDHFGNYEGALPQASGRKYQECDIAYEGGYRNEKRIVFSNDGLIFYTEDHYQTFEELYGNEEGDV